MDSREGTRNEAFSTLERKLWPLLVLHAAGERRMSPTWMPYVLFLVGEFLIEERGTYYTFVPHHYGPSADALYEDLAELLSAGLVRRIRPYASRHYYDYEYELTPAGLAIAEYAVVRLPERSAAYLRKVAAWAKGLSFGKLLSSIFRAFPWTAEKSVFHESRKRMGVGAR